MITAAFYSKENLYCLCLTITIFYAAPSGSPSIQSFLITSNTTAELNWQPLPPLDQNGVIVDYSIELCSNTSGNCSRWNTGSNDTSYDLEGEYMYIRFCTGFLYGESCVKLNYHMYDGMSTHKHMRLL